MTSEFQSNAVAADMNGMSEVYGRLTWLAVWPCEVSHWPLATGLCNISLCCCPGHHHWPGLHTTSHRLSSLKQAAISHSLTTHQLTGLTSSHSDGRTDCWLLAAVGLGPASSIRSYNQLFPWSDFSIHHLPDTAPVKFSGELAWISGDVNADRWLTRVEAESK